MFYQNTMLPPWDSKTKLFNNPEAQCRLTLDGEVRLVSVAIWEGYCYLKVARLLGLWGITQPYDQTDVVGFVQKQVDAGEVGRVECFNHGFSNFDPATRSFTANHHEEPLIIIGMIAIVRFDNSALARILDMPLFVETPAFDNSDRRHRKGLPVTKANRPSIWHPKRKLVGKQQIGNAARTLIYQPIPEAELVVGRTRLISELVELLESLFICASVNYSWYGYSGNYNFPWPAVRGNMSWRHDLKSRIDLTHFLYLLWNYYHYSTGSWIPAKQHHNPSISNRRYDWQRAGESVPLSIPIHSVPTAHQKMEASLTVYNWFKDKTSERELNKLLPRKPMKNPRLEELQTLARYCITKSPGFAAIALWVPYYVEEDDSYVAFTDGRRIVVGNKFWEYGPLERAFIFVHEIMHVALRHIPRASKFAYRSHAHYHVWNIAADAIINRALAQMGWLKEPADGVKFEKILPPELLQTHPPQSWGVEALYLELLKQIGLPNSGEGLDEWVRDWMKKNGLDPDNFDLQPNPGQTTGDLSEDVASRIWNSRLMRAQAGDRPGGLLRQLKNDFPVAKTPWPQILRAFLQDAVMPRSAENWSRPGRRMLATDSEIFEPATQRERGIRKIAIAVDTSGSINDDILKRFATEIEQIQNRSGCEIYLISADAAVQTEQIVKNDGKPFLDKFKNGSVQFKGGGGTAFGPAIDKINLSNATIALYLTDMQGDFGKNPPRMPFLWCSIYPNESAPFGKVIYLDPIDN